MAETGSQQLGWRWFTRWENLMSAVREPERIRMWQSRQKTLLSSSVKTLRDIERNQVCCSLIIEFIHLGVRDEPGKSLCARWGWNPHWQLLTGPSRSRNSSSRSVITFPNTFKITLKPSDGRRSPKDFYIIWTYISHLILINENCCVERPVAIWLFSFDSAKRDWTKVEMTEWRR